MISEIAAGVAEGNAKLSKVEQIKRFRVLPTFWEPGGDEITLTMKLKRKPINEKYAAEIEELYAADIADAVHEPDGGDERCAMTSRHVSVWVDVAPDVVYAIAADPQQLPRWASGLAEGALRQTADGWVADSPMGEVIVEFAPANDFGVLDHVVRMPSGEAVYNPLRVIPAGEGQRALRGGVHRAAAAGMTDEEFESDVATVAADLDRLRQARGGLAARGGDPQAEPHRRGRGGRGEHGGRSAGGDDADRDQHDGADQERGQLVHRPGHPCDQHFVAHRHGFTIARKQSFGQPKHRIRGDGFASRPKLVACHFPENTNRARPTGPARTPRSTWSPAAPRAPS